VRLGERAESNVVAFNSISRNQQNGVILLGGSQKNIVASNVVTANLRDGIRVQINSTNNFIVLNIAQGNGSLIPNNFFDLEDDDPTYNKNTWNDNIFIPGTTRPACVK
jgi:parallel beta-helix repeat protein